MNSHFDPPPGYDAPRQDIWRETVARLTDGGRIFRADPDVLDAYVQNVHSLRQVTAILNQTAPLIIRKDQAIENPAFAAQRKSGVAIARLAHALGLDRTPQSMTEPTPPPVHDSKCGGKTRAGGKCGRPAGWGTGHAGMGRCKLHGGASPNHEVAAQRERARLAPPIEISPGAGLLEEVYRSAGMVAWLESECATIPPEDLWRGVTKTVDRDGALETVTETKPHVKLVALNRERDHFASVCDRALARGAEQQMVDQAKVTGAMIGRLMDAVFARLELSEWQRSQLPVVVPAVVREFGQLNTS